LSSGPYPGLPKVVHDFLPHRGPAFEVVTRTDDRGRFRITAPNRHTIALYAQRGEGAATEMSAITVPVLPGDYRVLKLAKAAEVSGVVRNAGEDEPIAGARVYGRILLDVGSGVATSTVSGAGSGFYLGVETESDKDGSYALRVPAGCTVELTAGFGGRLMLKKQVTPGPERDLLFPAGTAVEAFVLGPGGKPVAGALLQDPYYQAGTARTDANGKFKLVLPRNRYWIHVYHPQFGHGVDYANPRQNVLRLGGRAPAKAEKEKKKKVHVLKLRRGKRLKARILGAYGQPLARARVVLAGMPRQLRNNGVFHKIVAWASQLDENGILDTSCWPRGFLAYVYVEMDGQFVVVFGGDVGKGIDLGDVKLPHQHRLHGTVHLPSRMPVAGARLLVRRQFDKELANLRNSSAVLPFLEVPTDRAGRFQLAGLRPGAYDLAVVIRNHFPFIRRVQVDQEDEPIRIVVPKGKSVSGTLLDANDKPVPHRPVRLYIQNYQAANKYRRLGFSMFQPITDKDGRFAFHGLPDKQILRINAYFKIDGEVYRSGYLQNVHVDTEDLEVVLTTSLRRVAVGK
ncbi:MAG: carboxypeptidase-like regulatory domain-containing protein, partial [Planctomycetota bacterium]